jgi:pSer/pThr/pTyr-binding forkhead associated (FHA) protein
MSGPILLVLRVLLALSLYAFLAWGIITIWKDVRQQGALLAIRKIPPISLSIQMEGRTTQARYFTRPEITIGRDPACDCPLDDESVSGQHVRLSYHHGQWWAEDLRSTNGTLLNRQRLSMPTVVVSDDEIACGQTTLTIGLAGKVLNPPTRPLQEPAEKA